MYDTSGGRGGGQIRMIIPSIHYDNECYCFCPLPEDYGEGNVLESGPSKRDPEWDQNAIPVDGELGYVRQMAPSDEQDRDEALSAEMSAAMASDQSQQGGNQGDGDPLLDNRIDDNVADDLHLLQNDNAGRRYSNELYEVCKWKYH